MDIESIKKKIKKDEYRFSEHAVKRMLERTITRKEVEDAILNGEIIEEYPDDKYSPSCLIYGISDKGRDMHVQTSLPPKLVIITTYEPDTKEWINYRIRRDPE